jgi:hypothetical protein
MPRTTFQVANQKQAPVWWLLAGVLVLCLPGGRAEAFLIVSPTDGATLISDRPVQVQVEASREAGVVEVRYFWYQEQTEALVERLLTRRSGEVRGECMPALAAHCTILMNA